MFLKGGVLMTQTPKLIQDTFIRLALEKPVDKITVREIVETCGINRNSFYYHYEDIPDLIMSILDGAIEKGVAEHAGEAVDVISVAVARGLQQNVDFCRNLYFSKNKDILSLRLNNTVSRLITEYMKKANVTERTISQEDLDIIIQIYRMETLGVVREWMQSGMKYDLEKRIRRMNELRQGTFNLMVQNAREAKLRSSKTGHRSR